MEWANVRKIHTPPSAKRFPPPPDEHALYKNNFVTGNTFLPPEAALVLVLTKRSAASGDERAGNGRTIESKRSCRRSLLASHRVMEMCRSCFTNTKYKCLRCELPTCNKCSVLNRTKRLEVHCIDSR